MTNVEMTKPLLKGEEAEEGPVTEVSPSRRADALYLKNGPMMNRSCTDVICCIIYLIFWVGLVYLAKWGFANGDPRKLA